MIICVYIVYGYAYYKFFYIIIRSSQILTLSPHNTVYTFYIIHPSIRPYTKEQSKAKSLEISLSLSLSLSFNPPSAYSLHEGDRVLLINNTYTTTKKPIPHGLLNCSFLKNIKNPIGTARFITSATQNHAFPNPGIAPAEKSGNTSPGPILSGAVARAKIVAMEPRTCAAMSVKRTWNRVSV